MQNEHSYMQDMCNNIKTCWFSGNRTKASSTAMSVFMYYFHTLVFECISEHLALDVWNFLIINEASTHRSVKLATSYFFPCLLWCLAVRKLNLND